VKKIVLEVMAQDETELGEFLVLCAIIQALGEHGAHRVLSVDVDGDGSGRLTFIVNGAPVVRWDRFDPNNIKRITIGE
jgi:hypothetical protein